jgi:hypothetical protein
MNETDILDLQRNIKAYLAQALAVRSLDPAHFLFVHMHIHFFLCAFQCNNRNKARHFKLKQPKNACKL